MICETCGRPKRDGLTQLGQAIFQHIEPHLQPNQCEIVMDAIMGFMAGKEPESKKVFDL